MYNSQVISNKYKIGVACIICCLGFIIYSNTLNSSFHFDDRLSILGNLSIRNLTDLRGIFDFWPTRFITHLTFAFNYRLEQFNVFGYHLFNLLIHLSSAILVWRLALLTLSTPLMRDRSVARHAHLVAMFSGVIFLTHPIQTQGVTYIIQRAASLATLFYLASLCLYAESRLMQQEKEASGAWRLHFLASLILVVLAMFTKEMAITLPLAILIYELCFFETRKSVDSKRLMLFLSTLPIIPLTMFISKTVNFKEARLISEPGPGISAGHYLLTQFRVMVTYLRLILLPVNQNLDYDYPISRSIFELPTLASLFFLAFLLFIAVRVFSRYRLISFSIFWFFLTLLPESSLFPIKDVIYEHRLYLPMVGFSLLAAGAVYGYLAQGHLRSKTAVLLILIACYSLLSYSRNLIWKDEFTLWNDVISKSPGKARPYSERGNAYKEQGNLIQALADFNQAIQIDPDYDGAYNNRATIYQEQGEFDRAIADQTKAIEINPKTAHYYYNRGNSYTLKGEPNQAIADYSKAIEINPRFIMAYHNRGSAYQVTGRLSQAVLDYNRVLEINPYLALTYNNRGNLYKNQGKLDQAILDYSKAIEIKPDYATAYNNRAVAYFLKKEYRKSWEDVRKLESLGYQVEPGLRDSLIVVFEVKNDQI